MGEKERKVENREPALSAWGRQVKKRENKEDSGGVGWSGNLRAETTALVVDLESTIVDCSVQALGRVERVRKYESGTAEEWTRAPAAAPPLSASFGLDYSLPHTGVSDTAYGRACCVHLLPGVL